MWSWSTNITDRQTDTRTDGRHAISIPRCVPVHRWSRGKKRCVRGIKPDAIKCTLHNGARRQVASSGVLWLWRFLEPKTRGFSNHFPALVQVGWPLSSALQLAVLPWFWTEELWAESTDCRRGLKLVWVVSLFWLMRLLAKIFRKTYLRRHFGIICLNCSNYKYRNEISVSVAGANRLYQL